MISSMTGYGRYDAEAGVSRFTIDVRSLNNRYLDIQVKAPRALSAMEPRVKKAVQERFSRGRFDITIARSGTQEQRGRLIADEALVSQYLVILRELKARFGLAGDVDIGLVASLPDAITATEVSEDIEAIWGALSTALSRALDELERMRREEGAVLVRDMMNRLETIDRLMLTVQTRVPATVENARKRMAEALERLLNEQPDPARLAQELAILAERTDVTEELTRLGSHMAQFRSLVKGNAREAVGRKLDFLLQEMGREANTIAAKATDATISFDVVNIKAELEKIREQAQNIE